MGQIDNLAQGTLNDILRRLKALEFSTNQNAMGIGRGGIDVYGGGGITIENGGLVVSGSADITGVLNATGTINMSGTFTATGDVNLNGPTDVAGDFTVTGPTNLNGVTTIAGDTNVTGDFTVTGPTDLNGVTTIAGNTTVTGNFDVNGPMKTTGTLSVEGVTTLKNDLNVTTGKVVAGGVTIDPSYFDGSLRFSNGTYLAATPNGAQLMKPGGGVVTVSAAQADMSAGSRSIIVSTSAIYINGTLPETTNPANLYLSPGGMLYKSTA